MKIGLLTFHRSTNYGSVLQAWAMQNLLLEKGYDIEIIDYIPQSFDKQYGIYQNPSSIRNIVKNILGLPLVKYRRIQMDNFIDFRRKHLLLSNPIYDSNINYTELANNYDCFICGSDQIWNINAKDCDNIYFLPGVKKKKIAYAVSVNTTDFSEPRCNSDLRNWIEDFTYISCREQSGALRISSFIGNCKPVDTMLDPTLLHPKEDYYGICSDRIIPKDYIFLYKVWFGSDSFDIVKALSQNTGLPVYTLLLVKSVIRLVKIESRKIHVIKTNTKPGDYLSLIRYASLVATDSFHGTAFSLIFEKPFYCINERNKDGSYKNDERILGILSQFGLLNKYLTSADIKGNGFHIDNPDYTQITQIRMQKANICIDKLITAIDS